MKFLKIRPLMVTLNVEELIKEVEILPCKAPLGNSRKKLEDLLNKINQDLEDKQLQMRCPWLWLEKQKNRGEEIIG